MPFSAGRVVSVVVGTTTVAIVVSVPAVVPVLEIPLIFSFNLSSKQFSGQAAQQAPPLHLWHAHLCGEGTSGKKGYRRWVEVRWGKWSSFCGCVGHEFVWGGTLGGEDGGPEEGEEG